MSISERDMILAVSYADGEMTEQERIHLELRMSEEDELRDVIAELMDTDELLRRVRRTASRSPITRSLGSVRKMALMLAAAALLLLAIRLGTSSDPTTDIKAVALAMGPTLVANNGLWGLGDVVPEGFGLRGNGGEVIPVEMYFEQATDLQAQRIEDAFSAGDEEVQAKNFVLALRQDSTRYAIVILLTSNDHVFDARRDGSGIAYPSDANWDSETGKLAAGVINVLPAEPFAIDDEGAFDYLPGFPVPSDSRFVEVLLATRSTPLNDEIRTQLGSVIETAPNVLSRATSWLEGEAFTVDRLQIVRDN